MFLFTTDILNTNFIYDSLHKDRLRISLKSSQCQNWKNNSRYTDGAPVTDNPGTPPRSIRYPWRFSEEVPVRYPGPCERGPSLFFPMDVETVCASHVDGLPGTQGSIGLSRPRSVSESVWFPFRIRPRRPSEPQ